MTISVAAPKSKRGSSSDETLTPLTEMSASPGMIPALCAIPTSSTSRKNQSGSESSELRKVAFNA